MNVKLYAVTVVIREAECFLKSLLTNSESPILKWPQQYFFCFMYNYSQFQYKDFLVLNFTNA